MKGWCKMGEKQLELVYSILQANPSQLTKKVIEESLHLSGIFCSSSENETESNIKALIISYQQAPNITLDNRICMVDGMLFGEQVLPESEKSSLEEKDAYNLVVNTANACGKTIGLTEEGTEYFYRGIAVATKLATEKVKIR